jgi:hypothetical protein
MDIIDRGGLYLSPMEIIKLYQEARKLAPPRFLTMKLHPDTWSHIDGESTPTHVIQHGDTPGPVGTRIRRLACVMPPSGIADGIAVKEDSTLAQGEIVIEIHGVPEKVYKNYGIIPQHAL